MKSKHISQLTAQDLREHPVWKAGVEDGWDFENIDPGGQMLPHTTTGPLDPSEDAFLVACRFTLADGSTEFGHLTPDEEHNLGFLQPAIVTDRGCVEFWYGGEPPTSETMRHAYDILQRTPGSVFPLRFETTVALVGGPITGVIHGFMCL